VRKTGGDECLLVQIIGVHLCHCQCCACLQHISYLYADHELVVLVGEQVLRYRPIADRLEN
jgi:hypothetical protein